MNPELPNNPREELELRVTSLLLGELSAAEVASVRAAIAQDAELQKLHDDLKQTIHLVREATISTGETAHEESAPLKLSEERRQSLRAAFVIPPLKPEHVKAKQRDRQWLVPVAAVAMILAVLGMWMFIAPRREQEGYVQLGLDLERASLASAQPRRVMPLAGQRPEDGRESGDRVQVSGQVATTTVAGRAAKTAEQNYQTFEVVESSDAPKIVGAGPSPKSDTKPPAGLKFRTWGASSSTRGFYDDNYASANPAPAAPVQNSVALNYQNLDALPAEPKLATPPTEIVLPKSGDRDGDALQVVGTSGVVAGKDFFAESDRRSGGGQGGGGAGGGGNSEASIFRLEVNRNGWFDDSSLGTGPQNRGEEVSRVENLGEVESAAPTFTERLSKIKSFAASGAVGSGEAHGEHVAGVVVNGDAAPPAATSPVSQSELGLNKSGTGTLAIGGANSFSGGTVVNNGTLVSADKADGFNLNVIRLTGPMSEDEWAGADRKPQDKLPAPDTAAQPNVGAIATVASDFHEIPIQSSSQVTRKLTIQKPPANNGPSNIHSLNVVGYVNVDLNGPSQLVAQPLTNSVANSSIIAQEPSAKSTAGGNQFVGRYAYVTMPTDSESLPRGKRESNIVLPSTPTTAQPSPSDAPGFRNQFGDLDADQTGKTPSGTDGRTEREKQPVESKIARARTELAAERDKLKFTDAEASGTGASASLDYNTVQLINARMLEDRLELDRNEKRYQSLSAMTDEEKRKVIPTVAPDLQLNEFSAQLNLAEQALIKASKDYSPDDPRYKSTKALVDNLSKKVSDRVDGVMVGLKTQTESLRAGVESRSNQMANAKEADIKRAKATQPYWDKKRELDGLLAFQGVIEQRVAMEKVDVSLPRTSMVTIYTRAIPPAADDTGVLSRIGRAMKGDYQAKARIRLEQGGADVAEVSGGRLAAGYDPNFIQTEFEVMKSEAVLTNVIKALDLNNKWGTNRSGGKPLKTSEALELLRSRVELKPVRSTLFTDIVGKSSDPDEAAAIANAVAEAYETHRLAELKRVSEGGIRALQQSFNEQQAKVRKTSGELAALRNKLNVSDAEAAGTLPKVLPDAPLPRKPATNAPVPQPEIQTSEKNFSTFSLNVSDVSFKLAAASLEKGQMPDSASIRSEEFINAFDYRDPEPAAGSPVAFAWERARYPFAHNRDLLRFSLKTAAAGRQAGRPLNIVLLLDNSGSMERADRVGIIREALRVLAKQLQSQDKLSVITFARTPRLVADGITGDKAGEVAERVSGLTPEGGTNLEDAMNLAYQTAAKHFQANGINRVVVLTDGAANLGNVEPESLKQKVEAQRKQGIALDCFGIGWEGFNDDLLEVLSRNGDGRYGFINSPEEAASEFAGQLAGALKVAASDVKVQVEWNSKRVTSYRQIGYAKHQLTKEQFRDNTVDAAEIAAQEAGNALYTVEVNPSGTGPLATVRCRYKIPGTTDYRESSWDVPFTGGAVSLEQSSPAMRLATTASAFSEWLAVNPFAGEVRPDALLNSLSGVPQTFGADPRPKKLEWMIRQAKSLEGK